MVEERNLELVVERFKFQAKDTIRDKFDAVMQACSDAEHMLYNDIWGALKLDLEGWKSFDKYPEPKEISDSLGIALWKPNWIIPPHEYQSGIRWKPFDGMQQFDVKASANQEGDAYRGVVDVTAYVWNEDKRIGCLLDLVNRNRRRDNLIIAETATIKIPSSGNTKDGINGAHIQNWGENMVLFGFGFPPNEKGDTSYKEFIFSPVDLIQRERDGAYRDR